MCKKETDWKGCAIRCPIPVEIVVCGMYGIGLLGCVEIASPLVPVLSLVSD